MSDAKYRQSGVGDDKHHDHEVPHPTQDEQQRAEYRRAVKSAHDIAKRPKDDSLAVYHKRMMEIRTLLRDVLRGDDGR